MKVYIVIIDTVDISASLTELEIEERLTGKELLWEIDELTFGNSAEEYEPIKFIKHKDIPSGVVGFGPYGGAKQYALLAASYQKQPITKIVDSWDSDPDFIYNTTREMVEKFYDSI